MKECGIKSPEYETLKKNQIRIEESNKKYTIVNDIIANINKRGRVLKTEDEKSREIILLKKQIFALQEKALREIFMRIKSYYSLNDKFRNQQLLLNFDLCFKLANKQQISFHDYERFVNEVF
jgi:hypothetical protein